MVNPSFTPKGRLKTCPYIQLYGKEWKALKEIRDSLSEMLVVQTSMAQSLKDLAELEREKLHIQRIA